MFDELRWLKYFLPLKAEHPIYLLFFVTSRCMGKCRHCFYWRSLNQQENPLTLEEIEAASRSIGKLLQLTLTGGEPLLREDLPEILKIFYRHNRPFNMGLATSGFFPDRLSRLMEDVLSACPQSNFTVGLPVEGPAELNDYIRDLKGAFARTCESLEILKGLKKTFPRLTTLVDLTASHFNQDRLVETYLLVRDELKPDLINLILTRGEPREAGAGQMDAAKIRELLELMEADLKAGKIPGYRFHARLLHGKDMLLRRIALDFFEGKKKRLKCSAGKLIGVLYPEGALYPCELWKEPLGNLRDFNYDLKKIWGSDRAAAIRREIAQTGCACYHQCFLSPSLFFDPWYFPELAGRVISLGRKR
jgi:MoaA/NifB/PqqE/SkfB family radical SAM enzyme